MIIAGEMVLYLLGSYGLGRGHWAIAMGEQERMGGCSSAV